MTASLVKPYPPYMPPYIPLFTQVLIKKDEYGSREIDVRNLPEGTAFIHVGYERGYYDDIDIVVEYYKEVALEGKELETAQKANEGMKESYDKKMEEYKVALVEYEKKYKELCNKEEFAQYERLKKKYG